MIKIFLEIGLDGDVHGDLTRLDSHAETSMLPRERSNRFGNMKHKGVSIHIILFYSWYNNLRMHPGNELSLCNMLPAIPRLAGLS